MKSEKSTGLSRKQLKEICPGVYIPPVKRAPMKHDESDLHLKFCKWVKKWYPELQFVRHEREKGRSLFMQNLMKVYNSDWDKLPDFEGLFKGGQSFYGFYLEFKKPGLKWTYADDVTIKKDYENQYRCHLHLWDIGRCAYFCNDFEDAKQKLKDYLSSEPQPKQIYKLNFDY